MTQFKNRARVPFQISKAQFPETRNIYRKSNGESVVQSIVIRKTYEGKTDWLSERYLERLKIALGHDKVNIETQNYYGSIVPAGDYQINWPDFRNFLLGQAKFLVEVTPFDATNSNCQTCEDAAQVQALDDTFPSDLAEDTTYTLDLKANDLICCFPAAWSVLIFNSDYLDSATIDSNGLLTIHTKTGLPSANSLNLLTYRITCPNGNYDEADVFGNVSGSIAACLAPTALNAIAIGTTTATIGFTPPSPLPDSYQWQLWDNISHSYVQSGTLPIGSTGVAVSGLDPAHSYNMNIGSICGVEQSNYALFPFTTAPITALCGEYNLTLNDPTKPDAAHGGHLNVSYSDCNGDAQTLYLPNHATRSICAMQTGPGSPTDINLAGNPYVTISYVGICGSPHPTLTFHFVHAGGFLQFQANLSIPIDAAVNVSKIFADGYTVPDCSVGATASAQKNSTMSIAAGGTGTSSPPDSTSGAAWSGMVAASIYNVIVNSVPVVDGALIVIGSYSIQIVIPGCS